MSISSKNYSQLPRRSPLIDADFLMSQKTGTCVPREGQAELDVQTRTRRDQASDIKRTLGKEASTREL